MSDLHHPAAHAYDRPVASLWAASARLADQAPPALEGDQATEVAIIGGGVTGLNAALTLARAGIAAHVVEAGAIGWGASGRNGGFCCLGSAKLSWPAIIRRFGRAEGLAFLDLQRQAIAYVRALCADHGIDCIQDPPGEAIIAHHRAAVPRLVAEARFHTQVLGLASRWLPREALAERGLVTAQAQGALLLPEGFPLQPLDYVRGLAAAAGRAGATISSGSPVTGWRRDGARHRLVTGRGSLSAARVVVATAGYTRDRLHPGLAGRLLPVLSNIVATRPLTPAEQAAQGWTSATMAADSRTLLHYFRLLPDGRLLFGARGGLSAAPAAEPITRARLERDLARMFPAWAGVETSHFWRGLTDLSADRLPHLGTLEGGTVHYALAWHGGGVAMGSLCGAVIAEQIAGRGRSLPQPLTRPLPAFPLPVLRPLYLALAYGIFGLTDSF